MATELLDHGTAQRDALTPTPGSLSLGSLRRATPSGEVS
jgi:hypothetical protein